MLKTLYNKTILKGGIDMKLYIGADHRGKELENYLYQTLKEAGIDIEMSKLPTTDEDDYPDFAFDIAQKVAENQDNLGILICGNGIGVSIAANKVKGIRCARVLTEEDAHHAKNHNGANMIAFGGISHEEALKIVKTFLNTKPASEERHLRRIKKIIDY